MKYVKGHELPIRCAIRDASAPEDLATGLTVVVQAWYRDAGGSWTAFTPANAIAERGATGIYDLLLAAGETARDAIDVLLTASGGYAELIECRAIDGLLAVLMPESKMLAGTVGEALQAARAHAIGTRKGRIPGNDHVEVLLSHDQVTELARRQLLPADGNYDQAREYGTRHVRIDEPAIILVTGAETGHGDHELLDASASITVTGAATDHHTGITLDGWATILVAGASTTHAGV